MTKITSNNEGMFNFSVEIQEKAHVRGDFVIKGIAINATTTANGHKFISEELRSSASTLVGVPLLKDHINSVDNIVGRVMGASFDEAQSNIPFTAIVKDPTMIKMIKDGLITDVSVGAQVDLDLIEENEDGTLTLRGITFKELSLVGIGADDGAKFGIALNSVYESYKSHSLENKQITERGSMTMTKEKNESQTSESTETNMSEAIMAKLDEMSKAQTALAEKVEALEVKESDVDEEKEETKEEAKEESKEETKEESKEESKEDESEDEDEQDSEVEEGFKINQSIDGKAFTYERKSYIY